MRPEEERVESHAKGTISRREFVQQSSGLAGGVALLGTGLLGCGQRESAVAEEASERLAQAPTGGRAAERAAGERPAGPTSHRVVRAHSAKATRKEEIDAAVVERMFAAAMQKLTGRGDLGQAMLACFPGLQADDVITLKINCINGQGGLSTNLPVINAIIKGLLAMELPGGLKYSAQNIVVWDQNNIRYLAGGLPAGVAVKQTGASGWDRDELPPYKHPPSDHLNALAKLLTRDTTWLVNVPVLKNHSTGITGCLKNHMGSVESPGQLHSHGAEAWSRTREPYKFAADATLQVKVDGGAVQNVTIKAGEYTGKQLGKLVTPQLQGGKCDQPWGKKVRIQSEGDREGSLEIVGGTANEVLKFPSGRQYWTDLNQNIADLNSHPAVIRKTKLCVMDALWGIYNRGPGGQPMDWLTFPERTPNSLLVSVDPVAMDSVCFDWIDKERRRQEHGFKWHPPHVHLRLAASQGCGVFEQPPFRVIDYVEVEA